MASLERVKAGYSSRKALLSRIQMQGKDSDWFDETLRIRCPSGSVPLRLYKFLSSESKYFTLALSELMARDRVWLSSRASFNDPLDTRFVLDFPESPDVIVNYITGVAHKFGAPDAPYAQPDRVLSDLTKVHQGIIRSMEPALDSLGIYSLTQNVRHPLMWAHYANSHRGIALVFRHGTAETFGAFPIRYQREYPRALFDGKGLSVHAAFVKGLAWEYEEEWRIVRANAADSYMDLLPNTFAGLVFGANATQDTYDLIFDLLKRRVSAKLPPLLVYRAQAGDSFELDFFQFVGADQWNPVKF